MSDVPLEWKYHFDVLRERLENYYERLGKPKIASYSVAKKLVKEAEKLGIDPSTIDPEEIDPEAPLESWHRIVEQRRSRSVLESRADLLRELLERELQTLDYQIEMLERVSNIKTAQQLLTRARLKRQFLKEEIEEAYRRYGSIEEVEKRLPSLRRRAEVRMEEVVKQLARSKRKTSDRMKRLGLKEW